MKIASSLREKKYFIFLGTALLIFGSCAAGIAWLRRPDPHLRYTIVTTESLYHVAFSPDGQFLATAADTGDIVLHRAVDGSTIRTLHGHTYASNLAFSPDGQHLVSAGLDETIRLWSLETGQSSLIWRNAPDWPYALTLHRPYDGLLVTQHEPFASVAFSPDGSYIVAGSDRGRVVIIQTATLGVVRVIQANTFDEVYSLPVYHVAMSRDNQLVVSVGDEVRGMSGGIKLWQAADGQLIRQLVKTASSGNRYSPDWAAFRPSAPNILTLDVARYGGVYLDRHSGVGNIMLAMDCWSLDGQRLPALPELASAKPNFQAFTGDAHATSFALSADTHMVAWGGGVSHEENDAIPFMANSNDPRIIVWRVGDAQPTLILKGHQDNVDDMTFSPDNTRLASVSGRDHTLRLWQLND